MSLKGNLANVYFQFFYYEPENKKTFARQILIIGA